MAIKLRCVFHGGEPPVQVSISRHKVIARAQSRMLSFVLRPRFQDGGSYVCQATDAGGVTVKHVIGLEVPGNKLKFTLGTIMFKWSLLSQQLWLMKIGEIFHFPKGFLGPSTSVRLRL